MCARSDWIELIRNNVLQARRSEINSNLSDVIENMWYNEEVMTISSYILRREM